MKTAFSIYFNNAIILALTQQSRDDCAYVSIRPLRVYIYIIAQVKRARDCRSEITKTRKITTY